MTIKNEFGGDSLHASFAICDSRWTFPRPCGKQALGGASLAQSHATAKVTNPAYVILVSDDLGPEQRVLGPGLGTESRTAHSGVIKNSALGEEQQEWRDSGAPSRM